MGNDCGVCEQPTAIKVKVKLLPGGKMPYKATLGAACYDLYAADNAAIKPGEQTTIGFGVCMEIPPGYEGQIRPRSGMTFKGAWEAFGTIDSDYRGEIKGTIINHSKQELLINRGDRIAQLAIREVPTIEFVEVDELSDTERGCGGFGSTGVK